jgi:hypothetical protein
MMTETKIVETFLPAFGGFYQSHWEELLSDSEDLYATMHAEEEREEGGLDKDDFVEIFSETSSVSKLCTELARSFCERFDKEMSKAMGFRLGLKFARLRSSSEYNFTTDRIVAKMPLRSAKKLFSSSISERHKRLDASIRVWFTPYPGFLPHYSDRIGDWIAKPIDRWDQNELCVLLDAFVESDIDDELYREIADCDACAAFERSVDWKRFEKKAAALRRKKTKTFLENLEFDCEAS